VGRGDRVRLDAPGPSCKLRPVSPPSEPIDETADDLRKIAIARRIVLSIAFFVGLTLVSAAVLGVYHHVTDRPAKELFGFKGH